MISCIVDLSHYNSLTDSSFHEAKAAGNKAIIHKCTQGTNFIDSTYKIRRERAFDTKMLWGAYHFGESGEPEKQAQLFIKNAYLDKDNLIVLDWEENNSVMSPSEAKIFCEEVFKLVGKYPLIYGSLSFLEERSKDLESLGFGKYGLWIARYGEEPSAPSPWKSWNLWQWTDGKLGIDPAPVPGFGSCDRSRFKGTLEELTCWWKSPGVPNAG